MFFVFVPIGLEQLFVKVCFRRCHCAPSMFKGPDGKCMVAMPCVVVAMVGPMVESQNSGCLKIRTAPTSGGVFDQFEDVFILQFYILKNFRISRRMRHGKPFSIRGRFGARFLIWLGYCSAPDVESGFDFSFDPCCGFCVVDPPAIFVVNLFPVLVVGNISPHIVFYVRVYWPTIFVCE